MNKDRQLLSDYLFIYLPWDASSGGEQSSRRERGRVASASWPHHIIGVTIISPSPIRTTNKSVSIINRNKTTFFSLPFQVNASDRLSGRVCHGCISFLNSWTSFKGRCLSAQREQKSWLAAQLKRQLGLQAAGEITNGGGAGGENGEPAQPMDEDETEAYNYYPQYNRKVSRFSSSCLDSLCSNFSSFFTLSPPSEDQQRVER